VHFYYALAEHLTAETFEALVFSVDEDLRYDQIGAILYVPSPSGCASIAPTMNSGPCSRSSARWLVPVAPAPRDDLHHAGIRQDRVRYVFRPIAAQIYTQLLRSQRIFEPRSW
jgi:hypothetical protein